MEIRAQEFRLTRNLNVTLIPMSADINIENFRQQLQNRFREIELLNQQNSDSIKPVELDQSRLGRLSRMDALQAQAMQQENQRRREQELRQIVTALQRIDNDDYGYCLVCDEPISAQRLAFNPAVALCIRCANQQEQQQ